MEIVPIVSALKRNKVGALLIALQIALTLAMVCNALFIIRERMSYLARPTGMNEDDVIVLANQWAGESSNPPSQYIVSDLAALRALPDVIDASHINSMPLATASMEWGEWFSRARVHPGVGVDSISSEVYTADEHTLNTLGLKLIAGRNFKSEEIMDAGMTDGASPPVIILSQAMAQNLFPNESAIGKAIFLDGLSTPITVVGIVERLQGPTAWSQEGRIRGEYTQLQPYRLSFTMGYYLVRAKPGMWQSVMQAAEKKLYETNPGRVVTARPYADIRAKAYRSDYALAGLLGAVCVVLIMITAFGIAGLVSFWVTQRRKQIGIRRALGATRKAILQYFLLENLMISLAGVGLGSLLSFGLNLWLVIHYNLAPLPWVYIAIGTLIVLVLGQLAVLAPARRAASIAPALAARAV